MVPVLQKVQPSAQPTCELTQAVWRCFFSSGMRTVSMWRLSFGAPISESEATVVAERLLREIRAVRLPDAEADLLRVRRVEHGARRGADREKRSDIHG